MQQYKKQFIRAKNIYIYIYIYIIKRKKDVENLIASKTGAKINNENDAIKNLFDLKTRAKIDCENDAKKLTTKMMQKLELKLTTKTMQKLKLLKISLV